MLTHTRGEFSSLYTYTASFIIVEIRVCIFGGVLTGLRGADASTRDLPELNARGIAILETSSCCSFDLELRMEGGIGGRAWTEEM